MTTDAVFAELEARFFAAEQARAFAARQEVIDRMLLLEDAVKARADGRLAETLESLRQEKKAIAVFRRVDEILEVRATVWWWCGCGHRVYDGVSDDDLMAALQTALLG